MSGRAERREGRQRKRKLHLVGAIQKQGTSQSIGKLKQELYRGVLGFASTDKVIDPKKSEAKEKDNSTRESYIWLAQFKSRARVDPLKNKN